MPSKTDGKGNDHAEDAGHRSRIAAGIRTRPLRVLAAPDKFRGTATAGEAVAAISRAADSVGWVCEHMPLADGGEGTLEAFGGPNMEDTVTGPTLRQIAAAWRLEGDLAIIEMARASGLVSVGSERQNDPVLASSRGTGELICRAHQAGARRVIVGLGGSASTDGGFGAWEVLRDLGPLDGSTGFTVIGAADVTTPFLRSAAEFGPQKGADPRQVAMLTRRLHAQASAYREATGIDVTTIPGGGAAGGLAGGLAALGARIQPGFDLVSSAVGLDQALQRADLVITGEGKLDDSSFNGKVVGGVVQKAQERRRPVAVIVGQAVARISPPGIDVFDLSRRFGAPMAISRTSECITIAATEQIGTFRGADPRRTTTGEDRASKGPDQFSPDVQ